MTEARLPPHLHALRWRIAILLCLVTAVGYVDRQALSVAAPVVREEFGLTNTQYGWITYAFLMAYAVGQVALGPVVDRLGTRRSFTLAVAGWSVVAMLHAFGRGFLSFFAFRGLLGVTESVNFPAALKAVAEWFPKHERSLATGIVTAGTGIGASIAPPLRDSCGSSRGSARFPLAAQPRMGRLFPEGGATTSAIARPGA